MEFPHSIRKLKGMIQAKILEDFKGNGNLVQVGSEKCILPEKYSKFAEIIYNFKARSDDVYISTFPRSGTTWTQEMIWLICNNLDYETATKTPLVKRFPFLEMHVLSPSESTDTAPLVTLPDSDNTGEVFAAMMSPIYDLLEAQTSPRFIKTHLPFNLMPQNIKEVGAKVVYVARNPKDVAASYYNFHKSIPKYGFTGDFELFLQYFKEDLVGFSPYWSHVIGGWNRRNDENVHFMFYEDLKFDMKNSLKKLAEFLGHPLNDEDLPKLMNHLAFENVKNNAAINFKINPTATECDFVRRGKVGGNPEITKEIAKKIDEWSEKSLKDCDLKFPHC